jgi:hypothetical protein
MKKKILTTTSIILFNFSTLNIFGSDLSGLPSCSRSEKRGINERIGHGPGKKTLRANLQRYLRPAKNNFSLYLLDLSKETLAKALDVLKQNPTEKYDCRHATVVQAYVDAGSSLEEAKKLATLRGDHVRMLAWQPVVSNKALADARWRLQTRENKDSPKCGVGRFAQDDE